MAKGRNEKSEMNASGTAREAAVRIQESEASQEQESSFCCAQLPEYIPPRSLLNSSSDPWTMFRMRTLSARPRFLKPSAMFGGIDVAARRGDWISKVDLVPR